MAMETLSHLKSRFGHIWEDVCGFIIRPERATYTVADLGPTVFRISDGDHTQYHRVDMELENMRGLKLQASWYQPMAPRPPAPCVVYLHGNAGSRLDAQEILCLLKEGFTLFTYDACGSGLSEGQYVSLGFYERQDLACVVEFLQSTRRVSAIGLWGRSMGAVTSIMYCARDPAIRCLVADSPFSSLRLLAADLVQQHGSWVPDMVTEAAVNKVRRSIAKRAGFDIDDLDALKYAEQCEVPAFIFHGRGDTFVQPAHSIAVAEHYKGSCIHRLVRGGHNSGRGDEVFTVAIPFLRLYLIDKVEAEARRRVAAGGSSPQPADDAARPAPPAEPAPPPTQ